MVSKGMIKEKKTALKPKMKSFKVRVTRVKKAGIRKMMEDQRCVGEMLGDVKYQCDELSLETQLIVKELGPNSIQFGIMFNILGSLQDGDDEMPVAITTFLDSISDDRKL